MRGHPFGYCAPLLGQCSVIPRHRRGQGIGQIDRIHRLAAFQKLCYRVFAPDQRVGALFCLCVACRLVHLILLWGRCGPCSCLCSEKPVPRRRPAATVTYTDYSIAQSAQVCHLFLPFLSRRPPPRPCAPKVQRTLRFCRRRAVIQFVEHLHFPRVENSVESVEKAHGHPLFHRMAPGFCTECGKVFPITGWITAACQLTQAPKRSPDNAAFYHNFTNFFFSCPHPPFMNEKYIPFTEKCCCFFDKVRV